MKPSPPSSLLRRRAASHRRSPMPACLPRYTHGASLPAIARWIETTPQGVSWLGYFYGGNIARRSSWAAHCGILLAARLRYGHRDLRRRRIDVGKVGLIPLVSCRIALPTPRRPRRRLPQHPSPVSGRYSSVRDFRDVRPGSRSYLDPLLAMMMGATVATLFHRPRRRLDSSPASAAPFEPPLGRASNVNARLPRSAVLQLLAGEVSFVTRTCLPNPFVLVTVNPLTRHQRLVQLPGRSRSRSGPFFPPAHPLEAQAPVGDGHAVAPPARFSGARRRRDLRREQPSAPFLSVFFSVVFVQRQQREDN